MAIDYQEVLAELQAEEKRLEGELKTLQASIPGIEILARRQRWTAAPPMARFQSMGTKEAIVSLLKSSERPLMPSDISRLLIEGGIQTKAADFPSTVTSTLNQMKADGVVYRVEDGWTAKLQRVRINPEVSAGWISNTGATVPVVVGGITTSVTTTK